MSKNVKNKDQRRDFASVEIDKMIGARLKEHRIKKEIHIAEIASHLSIHLYNINKYESATSQLTMARFIRICRFLNVSPFLLLQDFIDQKDGSIIQEENLEGSLKYLAENLAAERTERIRQNVTQIVHVKEKIKEVNDVLSKIKPTEFQSVVYALDQFINSIKKYQTKEDQ